MQIAGAMDIQTAMNGYNRNVPVFSNLDPSVLSFGDVGRAGFCPNALKLVVLATDICSVALYNESIPSETLFKYSTMLNGGLSCRD